MKRTMFTMGFNSAAQSYGPVAPQLGLSWDDVKDFFKGTKKATTVTPVVVPPPQPTGTVFGLPTSTVTMIGAAALGIGLIIAIVAGRKSASPVTAPK